MPRRLLAPKSLCVTLETTVILVLPMSYVNFQLVIGGSGCVEAAAGEFPESDAVS